MILIIAVIAEILAILTQYGQSTTDQIKVDIPKKTGKTAASVRFTVREEGSKAILSITGRPYFMAVQTGRKPTPDKKPSSSFVQNIKDWLQVQGKEQGPAYAIARSINQKGTKLWQQGGNTLISDIVSQSLIDKISQDVLTEFAKYYLVSTVKIFDGNSNQSSARS
jgi:hypothetical protein